MSFVSDMSSADNANGESKFTSGEKCIFVHLIVTFSLIILLLIVYFVHLCVVDHTVHDVLKISRRTLNQANGSLAYWAVGITYLNVTPTRAICNTLLLRKRWSLAPAHCASARSDPDNAHLLRTWRIEYRTQNLDYIDSEIKRSIPHPHFNRDDFSNNIGLFEHVNSIDIYQYLCEYRMLANIEICSQLSIFDNMHFTVPGAFTVSDDTFKTYENDMVIFGWELNSTNHKNASRYLRSYHVRPVTLEKCNRFVAPVTDLRNYEFCVILGQGYRTSLEHGAVFVIDSKVAGFFSWGEKRGKGVPFIIVNIMHFKDWLENIISLRIS